VITGVPGTISKPEINTSEGNPVTGTGSVNLNEENGNGEPDKGKELPLEIPREKKKERIDTFLSAALENATRSRMQKLTRSRARCW